MKPLALLAALLLVSPAAAQPAARTGSVSGTVRADTDGLPLDALVTLAPADRGAGPPRILQADVRGRFRFDAVPFGTYRLRATAVTFAPYDRPLRVDGDEAVRIVLREQRVGAAVPAYETREVVVTASRGALAAADVPVSVAVVDAEDLAARGQVTLDDALRTTPGVTLADNQVSVRGSSGFSYNVGSRVLFLVDGAPMLGPDADGVPLDVLPLDLAARVEVVKGPGSALYGSGALGGVVNLITKGFPDRPETLVRVQAGAYVPVRHAEWRAAWADADAPRPFASATVAHARRFSDRTGAWAVASYRGDAGHLRGAGVSRLLVYGKVGHRLAGGSRLDVLGGLTRNAGDTFLYWNGLRDPLNPGAIALGGAATTGTNDNVSLRASLLPTAALVLGPRATLTLRGRVFGVGIRPVDDATGRPKPLSEGTVGARYGGEAVLAWDAPAALVTAGLSADVNAARLSFFADDRVRRQPEGGAFAQAEWAPARGVAVTPGVRFDAYAVGDGRTERQLSPKLTATAALGRGWTARAAYGAGFRVPGVAERYVDDASFFPILANPALRPETSRGVEAGARGTVRVGAARLALDAAAFTTGYRRLVEPVFVTEDGRSGFRFTNLTRARIAGAEAGLDATAGTATFGLAYTLLDARDRSADRPLVYRNRHVVQARMDAGLAALPVRAARALRVGADYRYARRPDRVDTDFARFVPDADAFVDVHVLDARLAARLGRGTTATLFVRNALDRYYVERPAILAPPRSVAVEVRTAF